MSKKIYNHPDRDRIIKRLLDGDSPKEVELWLKKKHRKNRRYHVSYMTLLTFRKKELDIQGAVLDDIKAARQAKRVEENKAIVKKNKTYQDKIAEIADGKLDVQKKLKEMDALVSSRLEFYYDEMMEKETTMEHDKVFISYMQMYKGILQDWKKYIEGVADKTIEHNVNINIVNEQVNVVKSIMMEVLREMDPTMIPTFVNKVNTRMLELEHGSKAYKQFENNEVFDVEPVE